MSKNSPRILAALPSFRLNTGVLSFFDRAGCSFPLFEEDLSGLLSSLKVFVLNWFPLIGILYLKALKRNRKVNRINKYWEQSLELFNRIVASILRIIGWQDFNSGTKEQKYFVNLMLILVVFFIKLCCDLFYPQSSSYSPRGRKTNFFSNIEI